MTETTDIQSGQRLRMANHYEAIVLSMALLRGDRLSDDQKGQIVNRALAATNPEEFRNPGTISAAAVGQLHQFLMQTVEAGKPRNAFSADAARAAQAPGGADGARGGGFGSIDAMRGSSARYRDLPAGDSVKGSGSSGLSGNDGAVTSEYARSFAGTGMVGGTLRTFAEVGLDRNTFDAYRREGFSRADIADAANTAKTLSWKNDRQAFDDLQRSTKPQRAAIVEIDREKDAAKRETLIQKKRHDLHIDDLPQAAQDRWQRNIDRVQSKGRSVEQNQQLGKRAQQQDAALAAEHAGPKGSAAKGPQDRRGKQFTKTTVASLAGSADDLLGGSETAPTKPAAPKVAAAKPAAPGSAPA